MMKIILSFSRTVQTRPYESAKLTLGMERDLTEREEKNFERTYEKEYHRIKDMVEQQIVHIEED